MNQKIENIETESYALFFNVDSSVLKLNHVIYKLGFKFIKCSIEEFEQKFSLLYLLEKGSKQKGIVTFEHKYDISKEFFVALSKQPYGYQIAFKGEVFLLQRLEAHSFQLENNKMKAEKILTPISHTHRTAHNILRTLRLIASGDINIIFDATLSKNDFQPLSHSWSNKNYGEVTTIIDDDTISKFERLYPAEPSTFDYIKLAEDNFFLSCETTNVKLKYILLITCLESLFNLGRGQIAHTISNQLSLIISTTTKSDLEKNYRRNKQLYNLRNAIVHGGTVAEDLEKASSELSQKTRQAIIYCRISNLDKEKLAKSLTKLDTKTSRQQRA
jgi:hypothetical protein